MIKKVYYKSVIKSGPNKDSVNYTEKADYKHDGNSHVVSFASNGERIVITHNDTHATLRRGNSQLYLSKYEEIENDYATPYGNMALTTRVVTLESSEEKLSLVYELLTGNEVISTVYIMMRCAELDEEAMIN